MQIKSYPQLGGEPESIETTDMEDKMQTFVPGVQSMSAMQFTANYDKEKFDEIHEIYRIVISHIRHFAGMD